MHRDDFPVGELQRHLGTAGQDVGVVRGRGPGAQQPVQFVDPIGEDDEFVRSLYRLGRVSVVADHAAVVFDFELQALAPLPQPIQFGG
ncbi:hypothetical protein MCNS_53100 [Mycobacterium conspicuum]|uniref:Uncharacterized protein n=1 Tax=Mycobacterium conspicuum TaxID=44010 RepID=A0A7I7YLL1_9MYCO|nr:hypothetical protein MCNS_53100 [Mycobacterium conspicuum]